MAIVLRRSRQFWAVAVAVLFVASFITSILVAHMASAVAQASVRSIKLGSSAPGATTTYTVSFKPVTTTQELIVDFCDNSPLVGDTCTIVGAGTDVPNTSGVTSGSGTGITLAGNHTVKVVGLTMTGGTQQTIFLSSIVNPTNVGVNGKFYARVYTYATGNASGYTPGASPTAGTYVDYGGIAMSTANTIIVQSKVFETLSFCVFTTTCGSTAPSINLGDTVTGALATSTAYINAQTQYTLSSNAGSSVVVTMTGQTLCRVATLNFANCPTGASAATISAIGTTATAVNAGHFGSEQFGLCAGKNGSAALTVATAYNDTVNNCPTTAQATGTYSGTSLFGFDDTGSTGTNSAAGSTVLSSAGAVPAVTSNLAFAANIAATTEAGIYQSNLNLVATGTF
jgi:hypothetical protein